MIGAALLALAAPAAAGDVGPGLVTTEHTNGVTLGISGVAGLEFSLNVIPLDVVLEYRPRLLLIDEVDFDLVTFSGHVRYDFR